MSGGFALAATVFLLCSASGIGLYLGLRAWPEAAARRRIRQRMQAVTKRSAAGSDAGPSIVKTGADGVLPALDRLAAATARGSAAGRWIQQAGTTMSFSGLLLTCGASGLLVAALLASLTPSPWWLAGLAVFGGAALPVAVLAHRRRRRLKKFEEQFPEGLELMARSLRAGHGVMAAIKLVADEAREPVAQELRHVFDEQSFGLDLEDALDNLSARVPLLDVRLLVTAIVVQRQTGGNLAEVLDNLAEIMRERFKIIRQVRVHTAHGRLTGSVLVALPPVLAIVIGISNPEHVSVLVTNPTGRMLLAASIVLQAVGYVWMRRVMRIEV